MHLPETLALPLSMKTLRAITLAALAAASLTVAQAQGVRAEVGKPLQQAAEMLKAGKAKEALAKVREADAVGGKSPAEQLTIDRMKAAAAQRAGDMATAIQALESIHPKVSGAEAGQVAEQLASAYAQQRNNAKASEWLQKAIAAGNSGPSIKQLQAYLQSSSGDYGAIAKDAGAAVSAAEQAGRRPDEGDLLRLADAQQRTGNTGGYIVTLEKLLLNYPKKDYWSAFLGRLPRKAGFAPRFELDVMRLKLATGALSKTEDYMEMAQLSLQAGLPAEARRIADLGIKAGVLGTGPEAGRHQRLRELAVKQEGEAKASLAGQLPEAESAKEGDLLVKIGYAYASLGEVDKGVDLIQKGLAKGNLKRPEDAKLRLGMAQLQSPKTKAAGLTTLRTVKGTEGAAEIARLWTIVGG
jgi:tetratricopeptide (TPR) repeat protein